MSIAGGRRLGRVRRHREEQRRREAAVAAVTVLLAARRLHKRGSRGKLVKRQHLDWQLRKGYLTERRFIQRYRMDKATFQDVCNRLREDIEGDQVASSNARGGGPPITSEIMLSATLRFLAGGAYQDIVDLHGIGESTLYDIMMRVYEAMRKHYPLRFDLDNDKELARMEREFADASASKGVLRGVVGALDGIAIRIPCPTRKDSAKSAAFYNRKEFYAMNCQAICDAKLRFRWMSIECAGATHDQLAWECSRLGRKIAAGELPEPYCIFADAAYVARDGVVTPFSGTPTPCAPLNVRCGLQIVSYSRAFNCEVITLSLIHI
eukprot:TRINITY_DN2370_c0_g1_i7.p1 TRINITY_DN2370_c0_g1~~TRINITY_DN2370_c0_g1_i7.p1  ORF type:complete len:322 (+),score=56.82 TRINITY_DN2370_c0_g1_i7:161-1126(+)